MTAPRAVTVAAWLDATSARLSAAGLCYGHGTDNPADEAAALLCGHLRVPWDALGDHLERPLTAAERAALEVLVARRIDERVPVPYLVGEAWFAGLQFEIHPGVLIPRSPIAELIHADFTPWLRRPPERILDLCTGSGCIGIACAQRFPAAGVTLADIDPQALDLARRNVAAHGLDNRVRVVESDLFAALRGPFDLIVSNPPYVDAEDLAAMPPEFQHEPALALAGGADGLALVRRILVGAAVELSDDGLLVVEVGNSAAALLEAYPTTPFIWPDLEHGGHGVFVLDRAGLVADTAPRSDR